MLALLLAAESGLLAGLLLPGAATVLTAGFLTHPAHGGRSFAAVCGTVVLATAAGAHYGYARGRRGLAAGRVTRLVPRLLGSRYASAAERIGARPRAAAFAAHCTGGLRTVFPRMAADASVPYRVFAPANLAAAACWGCGLLLAGRASGAALDRVRAASGLAGVPLLAAVAVLYIGYRAARRRVGSRPCRRVPPCRRNRRHPGSRRPSPPPTP
ncbi:hypothetical protein [Actinomadura sp. WAC 06369]|uniref:hypothetical protein n=1 Tax=Actinomadura sp. WAC 06369 TaxID=2203193 RepID=UPI000F7B3E4C|nr:hypothetical protein [Actinomadura sp. WAC 06369]RSN42526.1 hypothetical protein DMH08_38385 [Actinomadura sp. WAC 06369]